MFTHLADETNRYARQRKTGKYIFSYLLQLIILVTCSQHETNSGKKKD